MTVDWLLATLLPAAVAAAAIAVMRGSKWAGRLADRPNERSLHVRPTPRIGGLGVWAGVAPIAAWQASGPLAAVFGCALALGLLSLADDARSLPVQVRLPAHGAAAVIVVLASGGALGWMQAAVAVFALVWMTNLFNFMDGADGLAGGMAAIGFASYAVAAASAGRPALALLCGAIAAASVGFLVHNFPPAKVFLGDAGSIPLGFLAGALGLQGWIAGAWPVAFPLLAFSPFIVDATVTILRRLARGERIWRAHRSHAYQRLALAGMTHRALALRGYALMLAAAASALVLPRAGILLQCGILFVWAAAYAALLVAVERSTTKKAATAQ